MADLSKDLAALKINHDERGGGRGKPIVTIVVVRILAVLVAGGYYWSTAMQAARRRKGNVMWTSIVYVVVVHRRPRRGSDSPGVRDRSFDMSRHSGPLGFENTCFAGYAMSTRRLAPCRISASRASRSRRATKARGLENKRAPSTSG